MLLGGFFLWVNIVYSCLDWLLVIIRSFHYTIYKVYLSCLKGMKMTTSKVTYQGDLRTTAIHLQSNNEIITDAPTDNQGKGEAFSPTDLLATSLASCMLTIIGIKARDMNVDLAGTTAQVTKVMAADPRRVSEIHVDITFNQQLDEKTQKIFYNTALTCPVAKSIHPDIMQKVTIYSKN